MHTTDIILHVLDDDDIFRELIDEALSGPGMVIRTYVSPETFDIPRFMMSTFVYPPQLVVTDNNMPFQNGLDFISGLLSAAFPAANIALMTGDANTDVVRFVEHHAIRLFRKPIIIADLAVWIQQRRAALLF